MTDRDSIVKKMASLVRSGAVMLDSTCPICGSPLFKLKNGDIVCPVHGKVRIVRSEEEASLAEAEVVLDRVIGYSARRIDDIISASAHPSDIMQWLSVLEKAINIEKELKNTKTSPPSGSQRTPRQLKES